MEARLEYGAHAEQYLCVHRPEQAIAEPRLAVLLHGGFWKAKYSLSNAGTREVAAALVARGWHVADIEYRRVGNDGGGWPGSNHDVLAALGCIREHLAEIVHGSTVPPRVALFGHSAGGQLAIWAAHFAALAHRVTDASGAVLDSDWEPWPLAGRALVPDLVVAIAPVSDLVEACRARLSDDGDAVQNYLGGDPAGNERAALAAARASPVAACMPCAVPTLVVSGRKDTDVPTEIALRYVAQQPPALEPARAWAAPMVLDDADHYAVFDGASAAFFAIVERAEAMLASDGGSVRPAV